MEANTYKKKTFTFTVSRETIEMLKAVKSSYQVARRKTLTYDQIIQKLIPTGLMHDDDKTFRIFEIASETEEDTSFVNNEDTKDTDNI